MTIRNVRDYGALGDGQNNDAPAIQKALDERGIVYIPAGNYRIGDTLKMHSHTRIQADGGARLFLCERKPRKRGEFLLSNADPDAGNEDITISGGIWDGNFDGRNITKDPDLFNPNAWSGSVLNFVNVKRLTLTGMHVCNSTTFYVRMARLEDFVIRDIHFSSVRPAFNQDGLHFGGHCYRGLIENITAAPGQTNDDMIALNADDSIVRLENLDLCRGPIEDVTIRGIWAENCYTAFRLLSVTSPIRRIRIENIYTGCRHFLFNLDGARYCRTPLLQEEQYPQGAGLAEDITVDNVCCWSTDPNCGEKALIVCESVPKRFVVRNLTRDMTRDQKPDLPTLHVGKVTGTAVYAAAGESHGQTMLHTKDDVFRLSGDLDMLTMHSHAEGTTMPVEA